MVIKRWKGSVRSVNQSFFMILSLIATSFLSGMLLVRSEDAAGMDSFDNFRESVITGDSDEGATESVTFVTEDDLYDEEMSSGVEGSRTESWIYHEKERRREEERCPPLPEPSAANVRLCEARKCLTDEDCRNNSTDQSVQTDSRSENSQEFLCCFNGCIHSCLPRVDPPSVFDWLEETDVNKFLEPPANSSSEEMLQTKNLASAKEAPEEIALPGGCLINMKQYSDLLLFRKNQHVSSCSCSSGDVVCHVNNIEVISHENE